jgi:hypothetical protein
VIPAVENAAPGPLRTGNARAKHRFQPRNTSDRYRKTSRKPLARAPVRRNHEARMTQY